MVVKRKLVDDWRDAWKWGSMRLHAFGTLVAGFLLMVPTMPMELQELVPPTYRAIGIGLWFLAGGYVRLTQKVQ